MTNLCHFSQDRRYRYTLEHTIDPLLPSRRIAWIGLNPSTANEAELDATLRRIRRFSQGWGYSAFVMLNLFAFRATDPRVMLVADDPIGPENNLTLWQVARSVECVVACWGAHGSHRNRSTAVVTMLRGMGVDVWCLGVNQDGSPKHPLYVAAATPLQRFELGEKAA